MSILRRESFWLAFILIFSICVEAAWIEWVGFVRDDAYITFWYSQNIARGLGFVFNVGGEPVYGTSSPGLALLLAAWLKFFDDPLVLALGLNILAGALSLFFVWELFEISDQRSAVSGQRVVIGMLVIWSDKLLLEMMDGMETSLVITCMMASLYFVAREKPVYAGLAAGWMLWLRLDSALWIVALGIVYFWRWRRGTLIFLIVAGMIYLPWLIFAQLYFGNVIPMTAIARHVAYGWSVQPWPTRASFLSIWLAPFTILDHPALARIAAVITDICALAAAWIYWRVLWVRALAIFLIMQTAMLVALNMTVEQRYFTTSLYVLMVLFGIGAAVAWSRIRFPWLRGAVVGIYLVTAFYFALPRMVHLRDFQRNVYDVSLVGMGTWLRENSPRDAVIYLEPLGYVSYYAERSMLDDVGLVTPIVVPFKRVRTNSFEIANTLKVDYMVMHCDANIPENFPFELAVRFDPLSFKTGPEMDDRALQWTACYEIHERVEIGD